MWSAPGRDTGTQYFEKLPHLFQQNCVWFL